jgi:O-antigen ligase
MLNYLLLLLLPTYLLRFPVTNSVSINLLAILLILTTIINLHAISRTISLKQLRKQIILNKTIFLPIILILFGFTSSYLINQFTNNWTNWSDGFGKLLDLIILPIIYAFSLSTLIYLKKISLPNLFKACYLSAIFISILGLIYFTNNWLTFDNRLSIFFQSPNQLAIFISPAILIGIHKLLTTTNVLKSKVLLILSLSLLAFNLYQTFSLGAWLAILISASYLIFNLKNNFFSFPLKLTLLTTTVVLISILNIDLLLNATNYQPKIPANSYDSRLTIYQVDQKIISTNWLFGVGINNFQNTYLGYQKYFPPYPQWAVPHAHNNLLHFWIEGGLLAGLGLFLLIYNILFPKNKKIIPLQNSSSTLLSAIFIYFIFHGLIDTTIWTPSAAILFFFMSFLINYPPPVVENSGLGYVEKSGVIL